jgi:hypothetical protein
MEPSRSLRNRPLSSPEPRRLKALWLTIAVTAALVSQGCGVEDGGALSPVEVATTRSALDGQINLALGKPTTQSTTTHDGVPSRAVDGNTNGNWGGGSVTHTDNLGQQWWQVDLQSAQAIGTVKLYNRTDCCTERLSNFRLRISADGQGWQDFSHPGVAAPEVSFAVNLNARYVRVELSGTNPLSLAEVEVYPPAPVAPTKLIDVDTAGCQQNVAINNAIGQSFRVSGVTQVDNLEVWIKPNLYYTTSYAVEVYNGEGTGGTKLATSPALTLGSQTGGTPSTWYSFSFQGLGVTLQPNQAYTLKLVRLSQYSGAFSMCGNVYPSGIQYWLGYSPDSPYDMSFKLYGTQQ